MGEFISQKKIGSAKSISMTSAFSPICLADGVPFTGFLGFWWWLRGVRRSDVNPNLCNR
jgi:hypothetical protein